MLVVLLGDGLPVSDRGPVEPVRRQAIVLRVGLVVALDPGRADARLDEAVEAFGPVIGRRHLGLPHGRRGDAGQSERDRADARSDARRTSLRMVPTRRGRRRPTRGPVPAVTADPGGLDPRSCRTTRRVPGRPSRDGMPSPPSTPTRRSPDPTARSARSGAPPTVRGRGGSGAAAGAGAAERQGAAHAAPRRPPCQRGAPPPNGAARPIPAQATSAWWAGTKVWSSIGARSESSRSGLGPSSMGSGVRSS